MTGFPEGLQEQNIAMNPLIHVGQKEGSAAANRPLAESSLDGTGSNYRQLNWTADNWIIFSGGGGHQHSLAFFLLQDSSPLLLLSAHRLKG